MRTDHRMGVRLATVIMLALLWPAGAMPAGGQSGSSARQPRQIEVIASRFAFHPNQITVQKGQPVTLVLQSTDVTHGLKIEAFNIHCAITKSRDTKVTFTPMQTGRFAGRCDHFCGLGHAEMTFEVVVQ